MNWQLKYQFEFQNRIVRYDIQGDKSAYPLVLVHGTPWSSFNLRHLIKNLASFYRVYYFDLIGYGLSDKSKGDVSLGIQNQVLDGLIDYWNLDNPLIIGHDFGGATVLRNHLLDKQNYKKIVLIDPVAISPWGSPFFKHIQKHQNAFSDLPDYIHKAIVESYVKTAAFQPLDKETLNGIVSPWITKSGKHAFYRQIAQADSKFTDEFQNKFSQIQTPVLILWGKEDEWIPVNQAYKLNKQIKDSKLIIIDDSGHLVIEEKPKELLKEIKTFFKK